MRVLVTGRHSYIGTAFRHYMAARQQTSGWETEYIEVRDDRWKSADFARYDVILHTAAIVHRSRENEELYRRINYELTLQLAGKARDEGVAQFVFLSTMAVYGSRHAVITADTEPEPEGAYGSYKRMAEQALLQMAGPDFKIAIVRPPLVYGRGCRGNFPRLVRLAGWCVLFPSLENKRSMIYIDNLCEYLYLIMERRYGGIGHPRDEQPVSTAQLVREIRLVRGRKMLLVSVCNGLLQRLSKRNALIGKLFGDCRYELEDGSIGGIPIKNEEYQLVKWPEGVEKSV